MIRAPVSFADTPDLAPGGKVDYLAAVGSNASV